MILRPHGRPFEKIDFEIEAFALEIILDDQIFAKNISMNCYDFITRGPRYSTSDVFFCKNQMQLDLDQSKQMRLCDIYYENIPIFRKLEF
jgi:hypothetical protein